jgi:hypothetical protein
MSTSLPHCLSPPNLSLPPLSPPLFLSYFFIALLQGILTEGEESVLKTSSLKWAVLQKDYIVSL